MNDVFNSSCKSRNTAGNILELKLGLERWFRCFTSTKTLELNILNSQCRKQNKKTKHKPNMVVGAGQRETVPRAHWSASLTGVLRSRPARLCLWFTTFSQAFYTQSHSQSCWGWPPSRVQHSALWPTKICLSPMQNAWDSIPNSPQILTHFINCYIQNLI